MSTKQVDALANDFIELAITQQDIILNETDTKKRAAALGVIQSEMRKEANGWSELLINNQMPVMQAIMDVLTAKELKYQELAAATEIVSNIASTDTSLTVKLVEEYDTITVVATLLDRLIAEPPADVSVAYHRSVESCIWALGNISGDSASLKEAVLDSGAMALILKLLAQTQVTTLVCRVAFWALSNFVRGGQEVPDMHWLAPVLLGGASMKDEDIQTNSLWALSYFADISDDAKEILLRSPVFYSTVKSFLSSESKELVTPALRTLGNMLSGSDEFALALINEGLIEDLMLLLDHRSAPIRKEVCWSFSNILGGAVANTEICYKEGVLESLIQILLNDSGAGVSKEAAWALANACLLAPPPLLRAIIQLPYFIQGYASMILHPEARLFSTVCNSIDRVLEATEEVSGSRADNPFLELLRTRCLSKIDTAYRMGGPDALAVAPMFDAFHQGNFRF